MFLYTFEWKVLLYWGVVGVHHAIYYAHALGDRELREARLEARLVEARLDALQRQLHPHFVFNTLHAIAGVLHRDPDAAESMLVRLGDLLRAVFRSHSQQEVSLGREIELTQQYLDIQRMRFGAGLRVEVDVPGHLRDTSVPVLVLQPLVENAIKHGFAGRTDGGTIRVSARQSGRSRRGDGGRQRPAAPAPTPSSAPATASGCRTRAPASNISIRAATH